MLPPGFSLCWKRNFIYGHITGCSLFQGRRTFVHSFSFSSSQIMHTFVPNLETAEELTGWVLFFTIQLILSEWNALGFVCAVKSHPPAESYPGVLKQKSLKVEKPSHSWYFGFLLQRNRRAAVQPTLRIVLISQEFQIYFNFHVFYIWTKTLACNCTGFCQ